MAELRSAWCSRFWNNSAVPNVVAQKLQFVLITPAHNEENFIARTIKSVLAQTLLPKRWVIVNDCSTDNTAEIIKSYQARCEFIQVVNFDRPPGRTFSNKARAFGRGVAELDGVAFDLIGNLDADISLEPTYFESLAARFEQDPKLGLAGGMVYTTSNNKFVSQEVALDSVAGAVQCFRRECFNDVGGYLQLPYGGIDAAAEIIARMKGWEVRTFPDLRVFEHRLTGSVADRPLRARIKEGRRMRSLGYSAAFFASRCVYRLMERPAIIGSGAALFGFLSSWFKQEPLALPEPVVHFLRTEQRRKLRRLLRF